MLTDMQIQMALASLLIIGVFAIVSDFRAIIEKGLWFGFDHRATIAVASSALGGLIVSAVLKYADSVLKGCACPPARSRRSPCTPRLSPLLCRRCHPCQMQRRRA